MDSRYVARNTRRWYSSIDQSRSKAVVSIDDLDELLESADDPETLLADLQQHMDDDGEIWIPVKFGVCPLCEGKGTHVNPNVDSHGICSDEWNEMGFEGQEAYMSGTYDITCYECGGRNVVPVPLDEKHLTKAQKDLLKLISDRQQADEAYAMECAAERRMGY